MWALVAGTVTALPLIDPYKPLTHLTLLPLVPLLAALVLAVRRAEDASTAVLVGFGLGLAAGVMFLLYFGWLVWAAPGAAVPLSVELVLHRERWRAWLPCWEVPPAAWSW